MDFFYQVNYIAVIVSAIIYFVLGMLWYSVLFGSMWSEELRRHNVIIKQPSRNEFITKMLLTFITNLIACFATAFLVDMVGSSTLMTGIRLGICLSIGFVATAQGLGCIWENRSIKLFLIDFGYSAIGITIASILLSLWR